jgi:hypothetical protein
MGNRPHSLPRLILSPSTGTGTCTPGSTIAVVIILAPVASVLHGTGRFVLFDCVQRRQIFSPSTGMSSGTSTVNEL